MGSVFSEQRQAKVSKILKFWTYGSWTNPQNAGEKIEKIDFSKKMRMCVEFFPNDFKLLPESFQLT